MRFVFSSSLLVLILLGCNSPKISYYKMISNPISATTAANNNMRIMVGPVSIPASLDRPQLVTQVGTTEVHVHAYHRWAGTLKENVGQVIASNLAQDLGISDVWSFSQSTQTQSDYQILIDVQSLDSTETGNVVLDVLWTIRPSTQIARIESTKEVLASTSSASTQPQCISKALTKRSVVSEPFTASSLDSLVAAQSRAFSKVAKDIARHIKGSAICQLSL